MKLTKNQLFHKVEDIAKQVKEDLRKKGYVVPVKERDGAVNLDGVRVRKIKDTFYSIYDRHNRVVVENLNSLQTAIVLANRLALNKTLDDMLIEADRQFGFQSFKLEVAETRIKAVPLHSEKWFYYDMRRKTAKESTKKHLDIIQKSYKKLTDLR
jgi:hypothetical protein